ncbi:MAG TPA: hypothetical protein VFS81_00975, partial [Candidatus Binatia bacterium]|nr:hypothetical protein [Candidatus Binatia bacterium]
QWLSSRDYFSSRSQDLDCPWLPIFLFSLSAGFTFGDETILKNLQRHELIFTCVCEDWRLPWNSYNLGAAA